MGNLGQSWPGSSMKRLWPCSTSFLNFSTMCSITVLREGRSENNCWLRWIVMQHNTVHSQVSQSYGWKWLEQACIKSHPPLRTQLGYPNIDAMLWWERFPRIPDWSGHLPGQFPVKETLIMPQTSSSWATIPNQAHADDKRERRGHEQLLVQETRPHSSPLSCMERRGYRNTPSDDYAIDRLPGTSPPRVSPQQDLPAHSHKTTCHEAGHSRNTPAGICSSFHVACLGWALLCGKERRWIQALYWLPGIQVTLIYPYPLPLVPSALGTVT